MGKIEKKMRWDVLAEIIKEFDLKNGVEIGTKAGENIRNVLLRCPEFSFIGIDHWDYKRKYQNWRPALQFINEKKFDKICEEFKTRAYKLKYLSEVAVGFFEDKSLDLVFIDAGHDYDDVYNDILIWLPKVREGGFICGHDYGHPKIGNVKGAVQFHFDNQTVGLFDDYVWAVRV